MMTNENLIHFCLNTNHRHVGGTSFVNASNDFSDLYSCIKATVTTMIIACNKYYRNLNNSTILPFLF